MIKSGISDKTIEEQCGKIGEEEKVSEKIEKTEDEKVEEDLKISDESERPYQAQIILLSSLGSGISLFYNFKMIFCLVLIHSIIYSGPHK